MMISMTNKTPFLLRLGVRVNVAIWMGIALFVSHLAWAQTTEAAPQSSAWQFVDDADGITIHTREQADGYWSIRARMFTPTSYTGFLALMLDIDNVANWAVNVERAILLKQLSPNQHLVYTQFSAPWPVRDRDMVTLSSFYQDDDGFHLTINTVESELKPEQAGYLRIPNVQADWLLQRLSNGLTHIEYQVHADPGGLLPQWLTNKVAVEDARETFYRLRAQLPSYQEANVSD